MQIALVLTTKDEVQTDGKSLCLSTFENKRKPSSFLSLGVFKIKPLDFVNSYLAMFDGLEINKLVYIAKSKPRDYSGALSVEQWKNIYCFFSFLSLFFFSFLR